MILSFFLATAFHSSIQLTRLPLPHSTSTMEIYIYPTQSHHQNHYKPKTYQTLSVVQVLQFSYIHLSLLISSISTRNGNPYCKSKHHTPIHVFNLLSSFIKKSTSFIQQHRLVVQPNSTPCAMQTLHHHHSNEEPPFHIGQAQNYLPRNAR